MRFASCHKQRTGSCAVSALPIAQRSGRWEHSHLRLAPAAPCPRRRTPGNRPAVIAAGGLFDSFFPSTKQQQAGAQAELEQEDDGTLTTSDGGKMVALDAESTGSLDGSTEEPFGPLAMLLVGFPPKEAALMRTLLSEAGGGEVRILTSPMPSPAAPATLGSAVEGREESVAEVTDAAAQAALTAAAAGAGGADSVQQQQQQQQQRVIFLSGMFASEVMEVLALYRESGLPPSVFAAAVPNNWDRPLGELVRDVCADHAAMQQQQRQRREQQQRQQE